MDNLSNRPIIIKRKKVIVAGGHHGGAWKVAYADFVTAMMAFFMLMWLLNATTEQQRKGIADYFSPTLPINRISGGGDGMFGGTNIFSQENLVQDGTGGSPYNMGQQPIVQVGEGRDPAEVAALRDIEDILLGRGGEALFSEEALRHVVTRLTDEGLIVEIFALEGAPLFMAGTDQPTQLTRDMVAMFADTFRIVSNRIAVAGHVPARPIVAVDNPNWDMSTARAMEIRAGMQDAGLPAARFARVTGHADRAPAVTNPLALRNDRIEITLLREDRR